MQLRYEIEKIVYDYCTYGKFTDCQSAKYYALYAWESKTEYSFTQIDSITFVDTENSGGGG